MTTRLTFRAFLSPLALLLLGGCGAAAHHAPTVDVLGSYFPAWIVCMIAGILSTVIVRLVLVGLTLDRHVFLKPLLYLSMAVFFSGLVWLMFFKN